MGSESTGNSAAGPAAGPGSPASPRANRKAVPISGGFGVMVAVVLLAVAGYLSYKTLTTAEPPKPEPVNAVFMCVETGKTFSYAMQQGEQWPVLSPYTGKRTAYPTEQCYWTRDGKRKLAPAYVVLNEHLGKPGDTFCPDCGRLVVGHNPPPPPDVELDATADASTSTATWPTPAASSQPGR